MSEMGFTRQGDPPLVPASGAACLAYLWQEGRSPPEASWIGLKIKATRMPDPPQDTTLAYRFGWGTCSHQPADSWPFGESWGLRRGMPDSGILERVNIKN